MDLKNLKGKKTYITTIAIICYALGGMVSGLMEVSIGIPLILGALGLSGLRAGIESNKPAVQAPQ